MSVNILISVYVAFLVVYFLILYFAVRLPQKQLMEFVISNILFVVLFVVVYGRIFHADFANLSFIAFMYLQWSFMTIMSTNLANQNPTMLGMETNQESDWFLYK